MINFNNLLNNGELPFININEDTLNAVENYSQLIRKNYKNLIIVGTGASVLNSQAIMSCLTTIDFNIIFLDNLDLNSLNNKIIRIDPKNTAILIISKSGNTHETNIILQYLAEKLIINDNLFIITEHKSSFLTTLGQQYKANFLPHAKDIGGRFAIFTNVGLLPAVIAGVDLKRLKSSIDNNLVNILDKQSTIINSYAQWMLSNIDNARNILIILYYSDQLLGLHNWQRQMYAESLGKNNFGFTPVLSRGTIDQHSQLQLYLDGPDDKFFEITHLNYNAEFATKLNVKQLFTKHCYSIQQSLIEQQRSVLLIENDDSYDFIAFSIIRTMLTILYIAEIKNIIPFGQPAVEIYKKYIQSN